MQDRLEIGIKKLNMPPHRDSKGDFLSAKPSSVVRSESWQKTDHALVLKLSTELTKPFLTIKYYVSLKVVRPFWIKVEIKLVSLLD